MLSNAYHFLPKWTTVDAEKTEFSTVEVSVRVHQLATSTSREFANQKIEQKLFNDHSGYVTELSDGIFRK